MSENRSAFTGKIGFVLAAAGSAVGLGNIWRFPYLAAKYGGGVFLLVYLLLSITFGFALMLAEIAIGRKTGLSAIGAFQKLNKKYTFIGYLASIVPMIILPYYCVIGGWVAKYFATFISGQGVAAADSSYFGGFISQPVEPVVWFLVYLALTAIVVLLGVEKGIEKISKLMMPVLVVLSIIIAIYSISLPGAWEGVKYYLIPNFDNFSALTIPMALSQLFYSMSLAMGIMITYGSYMKKDVSLDSSVRQIEIFDTGIAFVAGLIVIPAVFASDPSKLGQGPGLMFSTLPWVFNEMPGGQFIGTLFFVLVLFAALTSSISLMETVVSIIQDKFKLNRYVTCGIVLVLCLLLGIPSSLGNGIWSGFTIIGMSILDFFDFISNSVIMPVVALLTCVFVGYVITPKAIIEEAELTGPLKSKKLFTGVIKYFAPVCALVILVISVAAVFTDKF